MQYEYPVLVLVRGLPGSGKTYFSEALRKKLGADGSVLLDPDATDYDSQAYKDHVKAQTAEGVDPKLYPYRFLRAQAYAAIHAHKIVIWNQPFTNLEMLKKVTDRLQEFAVSCNTRLPILVVEVKVDEAVAKARVEDRKRQGGHGPSENTFARFCAEYDTCTALGYDIVTIDGQGDLAAGVAEVAARVRNILGV